MEPFLMKPKIDFAFKEIMENEKARTGFLAAVLGMEPGTIRETRILNPYLRKEHEDDKLGILDVRVSMDDSTQIDVEIQLAEFAEWADRSLFYLAKMFTGQITKGQGYDQLKKCVSISILDFILFEETDGFYSCFHIREDSRNFLYTDKMEFHVIELPKLPEGQEGNDSRLLWAKFINAERKEEFDMLAKKDVYIESAYLQLQAISRDSGKRMEYDTREKAMRDHNQLMWEARERGIRQGRKQGMEKGMEKGLEKGKKQGIEQGRTQGIELMGQLSIRLAEDGRIQEISRATEDEELFRKLLQEYGILKKNEQSE